MTKALRSLLFASGVGIALMTAGCGGPDPERNIILDREPFYNVALPYREGSEDAIVAAVEGFARDHGMDFLGGPGHPTLDPGQFNLTAAGESINLNAIRVASTLPNTEVFATVRGNPTANDKALTAEFVRRLQQIQKPEGVQKSKQP